MDGKRAVTLVDWDGIGWGNVNRLMLRLDESHANATVELDAPIIAARRKDGSVPSVAVVTFDGNVVRDTWVHGWAIDLGYVASVTW